MRKLKRAYQRNAKKQHKLRRRAATAGAIAAITIGTSAGLSKAIVNSPLPWQNEHQSAVVPDADADLLTEAEEFAIGYKPFDPDQNKNEIPDGVELARRVAAVVDELPTYIPGTKMAIPDSIYKISYLMLGLERCDTCGEFIYMGGYQIVNPHINMAFPDPNINMTFPDPNDPLDYEFLPVLALHYMSHGSFDFFGDFHDGRTDIPRLLRVLELRLPYEPNEHVSPADGNDLDKDFLTDNEELDAGYNLYDPDQNENLIHDGIELAQQCAAVIDSLPEVDANGPDITHLIYKESFMLRGLEFCDICGQDVNMGHWVVTNSRLRQSIEIPVILLHYMEHGSFSYAGDVHGEGRVDVALLKKILEMPQRCGDLGTLYLPADINKDCVVDINDVGDFVDIWLENANGNTD